ncbi:MAG: iron-containing alcohol dehydrogenase [Acidimicrobiia bacterium]|nr:iron-containing alcohol dehydrogenase [Acidimicrobiia bacterium]
MLEGWAHTSPAQQIVAGPSALDALPDVLRSLGIKRALLVTTKGRRATEAGERVVQRLARAHCATVDSVEVNVPAPSVQRAVAELRSSGADGLVSLGGGSAVDTAKALAFFAEHEAGAPGSGFADRPLLPHIAIPTTLVGAPYTSTFSMVDPHARRSTTTGGPTTTPAAVVIDLDVAADLPVSHLATSIAVALAHGIEAVWSATATPEAAAVGLAGLRHLAAAASGAVEEPDDLERRAAILTAAMLCGRARQNVGDGLQQALAQLVGARGAASHAAAHMALLVPTTRFLAEAVSAEVARSVAGALGGTDDPADAVGALLDRLGGVPRLAELGVNDDDLDAVARQSGSQRGVQTAARPVGETDVRALLDDAS